MTSIPDRRRFERVPFVADVTLEDLPGGPAVEARSIDIGLGGVGLSCATPVPVGRAVALTFHLDDGGRAVEQGPVAGRVVHLRFDDDGAVLGVEFTTALDPKSVPALVRAIARP